MRTATQKLINVLVASVAAMCIHAAAAASDAVIRGVVSDNAGKPIRGAMVKATAGAKTIARFSQKDGRYEFSLPAGKYNVSAEAFGFAVRSQSKDTAQAGDTNLSLVPRFDLTRITGAEVEGLLPDNTETRSLRVNCIRCHTFRTILMMRGSTAAQWRAFLPKMTSAVGDIGDASAGNAAGPILLKNWAERPFTPAAIATLADMLEKYVGPNAPDFGPHAATPTRSRIQHAEISDAVLSATFREYTIPTPKPIPHSLTVDSARGYAWFGEQSSYANKIGRFDMKTETFQEYPAPSPHSAPHTGVVDKDGVFWIAMAGLRPGTIASVDPKTGKITEYPWNEKKLAPNGAGTHTITFDRTGNLLISQLGVPEVWTFDIKKKQYRSYKYPISDNYTEDSEGAWGKVAGQPPDPVNAGPYHIVMDSKGILWFGERYLGKLVNLDPATGKIHEYKPPGTINTRGVTVDVLDNIWYSNYHGHKLGKLDQKTGVIKQYQPPTQNATYYGVTVDKVTGYIWCADVNGNNITRFDPKTEQFVEYPIPTPDAVPRFIDVDSTTGKVWFTEFFTGKIGVLDPGDGSRQIASVP
jgi:streptogramin lyase